MHAYTLHVISCFFIIFFLRFNDHWKYALQKLSFLSALVTYLKTEKLVSREETAAMIGG